MKMRVHGWQTVVREWVVDVPDNLAPEKMEDFLSDMGLPNSTVGMIYEDVSNCGIEEWYEEGVTFLY